MFLKVHKTFKATHIYKSHENLNFITPSPLFSVFIFKLGTHFSTKLSECIDFFRRVRCTKILRIGGPVKSKRKTPSFCSCVRTMLRYATCDLRCVLHMLRMYVATFHCPNATSDQWRGGGEKHLKLNKTHVSTFQWQTLCILAFFVHMRGKKILNFLIQRALLSIP